MIKKINEIDVLLYFINCIHPVSEKVGAYLAANTTLLTIKKGKFLISPMNKNLNMYFVVKGLLRGYIKDEGTEITTWINEENSIIGSIRNQGDDFEIDEYIQALEDCTLIVISKNCMDTLYEKYEGANIIGRKILEIYYRDAEERAYLGRLPTAEKRYIRFALTRPTLRARVSLRYLASYLNMKVETLCRVRAKISSI